jgi:hypothetical protein
MSVANIQSTSMQILIPSLKCAHPILYIFHPSRWRVVPAPPMQKREECNPSYQYMSNAPLQAAQHAASTLDLLLLFLNSSNVLPTNRIPTRHVFLHACTEAALFAAGDGSAWFGNAPLEAVFVDFLHGVVSMDGFFCLWFETYWNHTSINCLALWTAAS